MTIIGVHRPYTVHVIVLPLRELTLEFKYIFNHLKNGKFIDSFWYQI